MLAPERRRLASDPAHNHAMALFNLVTVDGLELKGRNIDENVALVRLLLQQLRHALVIEPELIEPFGRRHVERGQCRLIDTAALPQAMPRLKPPHTFLHVGVVRVAVVALSAQVTRDPQPLAQCRHAFVIVARANAAITGNLWPPAAAYDLLVTPHRFFDVEQHLIAAPRHVVGAQVILRISLPLWPLLLLGPALIIGRSEAGDTLPPLGLRRLGPDATGGQPSAGRHDRERGEYVLSSNHAPR